MSGRFSLRDLGEPPSHAAVLEYLRSHGWTTQNEERHIRCEGPCDDEGQRIVLFLPESENYADYPLRLEDLICALAAIEDRPAIEIVREMAVSAPAGPRAAASVTEAILNELLPSSRGVLSDDETRRLAAELSIILPMADLETEEVEVMGTHLRVAFFLSRLAGVLPDSAESQKLFGRLGARLLAHFGLECRGAPDSFADLYKLSRAAVPAEPDEVVVWLKERVQTPSAQPTASRPPATKSAP